MVREHWANCSAHDAACLPFGVVSELRRKLGPIMTLVLLLGMGVDVLAHSGFGTVSELAPTELASTVDSCCR